MPRKVPFGRAAEFGRHDSAAMRTSDQPSHGRSSIQYSFAGHNFERRIMRLPRKRPAGGRDMEVQAGTYACNAMYDPRFCEKSHGTMYCEVLGISPSNYTDPRGSVICHRGLWKIRWIQNHIIFIMLAAELLCRRTSTALLHTILSPKIKTQGDYKMYEITPCGKEKVIHKEKCGFIDKKDLYTKLYTLSTFFCEEIAFELW